MSSSLAPAFVGRSREIAEVQQLLSCGRLVTVTGAPGAGKTRLALEAATRLAPHFDRRLYVCELAPVAAPALVRTALATAFGLPPEVSGDLAAVVRDRFGDSPTLMVVDNCEHVRAEIGTQLNSILGVAPGIHVLATSRERLRIPGETAWTLPPMNVEEALQLLALRVTALDATFAVSPDNLSTLVAICERLERLPLALELVAARLALLPAAQVAKMLHDSIELLTTGHGWSRHRTMTAAIDWSVALLPSTSASDLWRLSVLPASFTLDAAAIVLEASAIGALDRLAILREASILVADKSGDAAKFRLLEPVRQYALAHLTAGPIEEEVRRLHAAYVLGRTEWIGARLLGTPEQAAALDAFADLLPDLRQAVSWSKGAEPAWAARIVANTGWAWEITSRLREGETLMRTALELAADVRDRARVLLRLMSIVHRRNGEEAALIGPEAVLAAAQAGDRRELGLALSFQTNYLSPDAAVHQLDLVAKIVAETGDQLVRCWERFFRAWRRRDAGDLRSAKVFIEDAASIAFALGDRWCTTQATSYAAGFCLELGDNDAARRHLLSILPGLADHSDWLAGHELLSFTALLALRTGRSRDALRLVAAARRLRHEIGHGQWDDAEVQRVSGIELKVPVLSFPEALELARDVLENPAPPLDRRKRGVLTRRERQVAELVEQGLTNREIASKLFITQRTAEGHVEQARNKLGFRTRAQLAAWAARERLTVETGKAGTKNP